jgi:hypothetical protein
VRSGSWRSRAEPQLTAVPGCRERRNLATTLNDTNGVIRTLQALVGCVMHTCAFFAYLAIFGVDVGHLVISLSSMALASAFIFGNSMRTVYESVIFLFVVHPYQVPASILPAFQDATLCLCSLMC